MLSKLFQELSGFFWNLFSFSLSYFYLLEGSKIFFMSSKYFILIVHVPMSLWEFSWIVCDFLSIFRAFKTISRFLWNCFRIKKIRKIKIKLSLSSWAGPEVPTLPGPPQPISAQPLAQRSTSAASSRAAAPPPPRPRRARHGQPRACNTPE
jgi:hypothetical protein